MERTYKFRNGTIHVMLPESCDREKLKKATEQFLKKVVSEGIKNGYSYTSGNLREK